MVGVVLVGVVGMDAVGVVGGDQQRLLDGTHELVALGQQAAQGLLEHRAVGAAGRAGTDFLMVVAHQHAGFLAVGIEQGLQAGVAGQQVVQARAGDEVLVQADHRRALGIVEAQFVVQHHVGVQAVFTGQLVGQHGTEIHTLVAGELGEDRWQFVLRVDGPTLVGFTVEVDGQVGNDRDRRLEVDQLAFHLAIAAEGHPAGQGQVAVEPGGQQCATVDFHAQLPEALALQFRLRLDPQARAVGMGADHADAAVQRGVPTQLDGDDGGIIARDVVAAIGLGGPRLALVQALVACCFQALNQAGSGMERGRGGLEEVDQALVQLFAHK